MQPMRGAALPCEYAAASAVCGHSRSAGTARIRNDRHRSSLLDLSVRRWQDRRRYFRRPDPAIPTRVGLAVSIHPLLGSDASLRKGRESKAGAKRQQSDQSNQRQRASGLWQLQRSSTGPRSHSDWLGSSNRFDSPPAVVQPLGKVPPVRL